MLQTHLLTNTNEKYLFQLKVLVYQQQSGDYSTKGISNI